MNYMVSDKEQLWDMKGFCGAVEGRARKRSRKKNDERVDSQSFPKEIEISSVSSCSIKKKKNKVHLVKWYIKSSSAYFSVEISLSQTNCS